MRMAGARARGLAVAAGVVAFWMASCRDVPAPEGGVASISALLLPSPGVVAGDTLRDSLGIAAPIRVIAYDLAGNPIDPQPTPVFVALDTGAVIDAGFLIGQDTGTTVRIVGSIASLQTRPDSVRVTKEPDIIVAADSVNHVKTYEEFAGTTVNSAELATIVKHGGASGTPVRAVIVKYAIDSMPPGSGSAPTMVLMNNSVESTGDTTDANGRASRFAQMRIAAFTPRSAETTYVSATASYRGATLGTVQFRIIFKKQE